MLNCEKVHSGEIWIQFFLPFFFWVYTLHGFMTYDLDLIHIHTHSLAHTEKLHYFLQSVAGVGWMRGFYHLVIYRTTVHTTTCGWGEKGEN